MCALFTPTYFGRTYRFSDTSQFRTVAGQSVSQPQIYVVLHHLYSYMHKYYLLGALLF